MYSKVNQLCTCNVLFYRYMRVCDYKLKKVKSEVKNVSFSVKSDSVWPHGLQSFWLLCPWSSPGKNTGVGVAIPFSRESSWSRGQTQISSTAGRFFTIYATREALCTYNVYIHTYIHYFSDSVIGYYILNIVPCVVQ